MYALQEELSTTLNKTVILTMFLIIISSIILFYLL